MKNSELNKLTSISLTEKMKENKGYNFMVGKVGTLIQLSVYKNTQLSHDIFIDLEKEDWATKVYQEGPKPKLSAAMIENLFCFYNNSITIDNDSILKKAFNSNSEGFFLLMEISHWQKDIREKQNDARLNKIFTVWDKELEIFPKEILPSFEKFMAKESDGHYFMFYENKNSTTGYCSHCRKDVPLMKTPKQNDECRCPSCRKKAVLKRQSQITTLKTYWYSGAYAQEINGTIIIRKFYGCQSYRGRDYKNPHITLNESVRYILYSNGTISRYWHGMYNQKICRWNKNTRPEDYWVEVHESRFGTTLTNVYTKNLKKVLTHSAWNCWKKKPTDVFTYLISECQTKGLVEKLVKIGLFNVARSFMSLSKYRYEKAVNPDGKNLGQIIKLDNSRLKRLMKNDSVTTYQWLLLEKEHNTILSDEILNRFSELGLTPRSFDNLPEAMTLLQIDNYILKQSKLSSEDYKQTLSNWKDYLYMAKKNGWDMNASLFYKPSDLKEMHMKAIMFRDGSSIEKEIKEIEKEWPIVNNNLALMKKFEYSNDEYCILVPENVADIVREGHCLQHCIHNVSFYFERISKRESYIFFLRKKQKSALSWYTLEVAHNGNILQKRTTGDNQNKDLEVAIPFLKEFQQHFIKTMSDEDKQLGIIAEENRKKRYKELRDKVAKINKGKLAGQLLADVLEADLMVA